MSCHAGEGGGVSWGGMGTGISIGLAVVGTCLISGVNGRCGEDMYSNLAAWGVYDGYIIESPVCSDEG